MDKARIIKTLETMAVYLELSGAGPFEIMAYRNGAQNLEDHDEDLAQVIASGTLTDIPGIGKGLAKVITALHQDGRSPEFEDLKSRFPENILDLTYVSGLGPKKIKALHEQLGVDGLDALEKVAKEERIRELKGFGKKTEETILERLPKARERLAKYGPKA